MNDLMLPHRGDLWAVFVGINEYDDSEWGPLPYCESDATDLASIFVDLTRGGYAASNIRLLANSEQRRFQKPTKSNIIASLGHIADAAGKEDSIFFGFFGHGLDVDGISYIFPSDGWKSHPTDTAISLEQIQKVLQSSKARFKISVFDACHSGALRGRSGAGEMSATFARMLLEEFVKSNGWAVLSACKQDEQSHDYDAKQHGVFTYHLLEGLRGEADSPPIGNGDGFITVYEASQYATIHTRRWAFENGVRQNPELRWNVSGDIVLVRSRDGDLPPPPDERPSDAADAFCLAVDLVSCAAADSGLWKLSPDSQRSLRSNAERRFSTFSANLGLGTSRLVWQGNPLPEGITFKAREIRECLRRIKSEFVAEAFWLGVHSGLATLLFEEFVREQIDKLHFFYDNIQWSGDILGVPEQTLQQYLDILNNPSSSPEIVSSAWLKFHKEVVKYLEERPLTQYGS